MSDHQVRPFPLMLRAALEMCSFLMDACTRVQLGGSLRRGKAEVSDIEIIVSPKYEPDQRGIPYSLLEARCAELEQAKLISPRQNKNQKNIAWGEAGREVRYKAMWFMRKVNGQRDILPVDLFIVLSDRQWGPTSVIRTGPNRANQVLVTRRGVPTAEFGDKGILPPGMKFSEGGLYRDGELMDTPEEADVFEEVGLPYLPPYARLHWVYQQWAGIIPQTDWLPGWNEIEERQSCEYPHLKRVSPTWPGLRGKLLPQTMAEQVRQMELM